MASILIVGAGPTGLTTALALAKYGIKTRIIEENIHAHGAIRGTAIVPRTQELLTILGLEKDLFEIATPPLQMAVHNGNELLKVFEWSEAAPERSTVPFRNVASVSQARLEAILRQHLKSFGIEVEMGKRLVGIEQDEDKVAAKIQAVASAEEDIIECQYLVAADGAKGRSRRLVNVSFLGETKEADRMWSANVEVEGLTREYWSRWADFQGSTMIFLKPIKPAPLFQLQALGPDLPKGIPTDATGLQALFNSISKRDDIRFIKAEWISEWRANIRMVDKFSVGRVFLAGDAAHCHSPAGGQGTNTAMQDAFNLAWKLALVIKSKAASELLKSYEAERMPVVAEMLDLSSQLHAKAWAHIPNTAFQRHDTQQHGVEEPMLRSSKLLQLGVNYRWSSIVRDERAGTELVEHEEKHNPYGSAEDSPDVRLRAGDRAPYIRRLRHGDEEMDLFALLRENGGSHLTLLFPSVGATVLLPDLQGLERYISTELLKLVVIGTETTVLHPTINVAVYLLDTDREAAKAYDIDPGRKTDWFITIRPDGVIGAITSSVDGIIQYFFNLGVE